MTKPAITFNELKAAFAYADEQAAKSPTEWGPLARDGAAYNFLKGYLGINT
jgi:hypothetical protein